MLCVLNVLKFLKNMDFIYCSRVRGDLNRATERSTVLLSGITGSLADRRLCSAMSSGRP